MALADPLAEIMLHFDCPACGTSFDESLDLAAFLWAEIEGQAKRLCCEVHTLASAYGWSETEILSLSAGAPRILPRDGARMTGYLQRLAASVAGAGAPASAGGIDLCRTAVGSGRARLAARRSRCESEVRSRAPRLNRGRSMRNSHPTPAIVTDGCAAPASRRDARGRDAAARSRAARRRAQCRRARPDERSFAPRDGFRPLLARAELEAGSSAATRRVRHAADAYRHRRDCAAA